jgi:hypothetical protein
MKTFETYLGESPLPPRQTETYLPLFQSLTFSDLIRVFTAHFGKPIGNGSSRSVYHVKMDADEFNKDMKEELGLDATYKGEVDTVFKVAKNAKGVVQNKKEADVYRDARVLHYHRWLCPIIDCSKQILNLKDSEIENLDWEEGMMFVQAGKCDKLKSEKQLSDILLKVFGPNNEITKGVADVVTGYNFTLHNLATLVNNKVKSAYNTREKLESSGLVTEEQKDNFNDFINMCNELGIGDLYQKSNWGLYKGNPVLLDYGFVKDSTDKIYWNNDYALDTLKDTNSGNIMYKIRKVK